MTNRFDNWRTDDLIAQEAKNRAQLAEMVDALEARLLAECKVRIGKLYQIGPALDTIWPWNARYVGRTIWVRYLNVKRHVHGLGPGQFTVVASGPLKRPKPGAYGWQGGKYTSVHPDVVAARLDISTEAEGPEEK